MLLISLYVMEMIRANVSNDPPPGHSPGPPLTETMSTPLPSSLSSLATILSRIDISRNNDKDNPLHQLHNSYDNITSNNFNKTNYNNNYANNSSNKIRINDINSNTNISKEEFSKRNISKIETINVWFNNLLKNTSISSNNSALNLSTNTNLTIIPSLTETLSNKDIVIHDRNYLNRTQFNRDKDSSVVGASFVPNENNPDCGDEMQINTDWDAKITNQSGNSTFPKFDFQFKLQNSVFQVSPNHLQGINCGIVYEGKFSFNINCNNFI